MTGALRGDEEILPEHPRRSDDEQPHDPINYRIAPVLPGGHPQRERLESTLRAWLDRHGLDLAGAAALGVHPQTVRYRMTRLRELFGERLEDPEARFELGLALRVAPMR